MRWFIRLGFPLAIAASCLLLVGCSTPRGSKTAQVDPYQLAKSDIDRIADAHLRQLDSGLRTLAEKLYRRNPREWRNAGLASHEAAISRLFASGDFRLEEFKTGPAAGKSGTELILLALREDYTGDRVAAYIAGMGSMMRAAFNERTEFYMFDDLDPQRLYNAARNLEIAAWKLSNARDTNGQLLLLSNEIAPVANLSFEREFGKMIGNLDLLSGTIADKTNRTVVKVIQSLATAVFLPVASVLR